PLPRRRVVVGALDDVGGEDLPLGRVLPSRLDAFEQALRGVAARVRLAREVGVEVQVPARRVRLGLFGLLELLRVHPGDLHEAAQGDHADAVLGLTPFDAGEVGGEEGEETLDPHAGQLRHREVAALVQDDQRGEAQDDEDPGHATAWLSITPRAWSRAARSTSKSCSKWRSGPPGTASR